MISLVLAAESGTRSSADVMASCHLPRKIRKGEEMGGKRGIRESEMRGVRRERAAKKQAGELEKMEKEMSYREGKRRVSNGEIQEE